MFPDYFLSHDYVYKDVWFPLIEKEGLECLYEKENGKYKFAISVHRNQLCHKLFVGHLPLNLLKILLIFLQLSSSILGCKVTEDWMNRFTGFDLEISFNYTCRGLEKAVIWIQRNISEEMKASKKWKSYGLNKILDYFSSPVC